MAKKVVLATDMVKNLFAKGLPARLDSSEHE